MGDEDNRPLIGTSGSPVTNDDQASARHGESITDMARSSAAVLAVNPGS
jgi:hypothetical protein